MYNIDKMSVILIKKSTQALPPGLLAITVIFSDEIDEHRLLILKF